VLNIVMGSRIKILLIVIVLITILIQIFDFLNENLYGFIRGLDQKAWDSTRGQVMEDFF